MTRDDIDAYAKKHNITLQVSKSFDTCCRTNRFNAQSCVHQAWAPLVRALRFDHPELKRIAKTHGKETPQILLRYSLQRVSTVIMAPKGVLLLTVKPLACCL